MKNFTQPTWGMWKKYGNIYRGLKPKWDRLMEEIGIYQGYDAYSAGHPKEEVAFLEICKKYSEKERYYHTPRHILDCLKEFEGVRGLIKHPLELQVGLVGHDVIYDTKAKDNEQQSANYMHNLFLRLGSSPDFANRMGRIILTTDHKTSIENIDESLAVDIDLSILGADKEKFDEYDENIRKEYSWVLDEDFKKGRVDVLQSFLDRENIYATEFFREKYEEKARDNLRRTIKIIEKN